MIGSDCSGIHSRRELAGGEKRGGGTICAKVLSGWRPPYRRVIPASIVDFIEG